jgi:serine/threonine-protein kinase
MIGQIINNTYRIEQKIGEGGMGAVYRGRDLVLDRDVAVKSLRPELAQQPDLVGRFRDEARTLARLNHSNVTTIYSFLPHGDNHAMVMEFVPGKPLDKILEHHGALDVVTAARLFCQALDGVAHAHALGIIHRDIKPANLLVTAQGEVKVTDFGIARVLGTARQTKTGRLIGTLEYMSPEQVRGLESDARSDVYALGILLYEMVTGRVPFGSDSDYELIRAQVESAPPPPREFNGEIPAPIELAILRALAKHPASRFQTVNEFRAAITGALPEAVMATEPLRLWDEPLIKETRQAFDVSELMNQAANEPAIVYAAPQSGVRPFARKMSAPAWLNRFDKRHYAAAASVLLTVTVGWAAMSLWNPGPTPIPVTPSPAPQAVQPTPAPAQPQPAGLTDPFSPSSRPTVVDPQPGAQPQPLERRIPAESTVRTTRAERPAKPEQQNARVVNPPARSGNNTSAREPERSARLENENRDEKKQDGKKKEERSKTDQVLDVVKTGVGVWGAIKRKH